MFGINKNNPFRKQIDDFIEKKQHSAAKMRSFGNSMAKAMRLSYRDQQCVADEGIILTTKNYLITGECLRLDGDWEYFLVALPKESEGGKPPSDWDYQPKGTATITVPCADDCKKILKEIEEIINEG